MLSNVVFNGQYEIIKKKEKKRDFKMARVSISKKLLFSFAKLTLAIFEFSQGLPAICLNNKTSDIVHIKIKNSHNSGFLCLIDF